jgi:hypothetical protein
MLRWQVGDETIENLDYFKVDNLWEPARINRSLRGTLRMEIEQKISAVDGALDPNMFTPPTSHWNKLFQCQTWRRAIGTSTPQPAPGNLGTDTVDVLVTGMIRETGKTEALKIQSSPRPDLNAEALSTVSQWTFQPMMCNDKWPPREPTLWFTFRADEAYSAISSLLFFYDDFMNNSSASNFAG